MSQQVNSQTQAVSPNELQIKTTPLQPGAVLLASENGLTVKQVPTHLLDPLRGLMLISTGLI